MPYITSWVRASMAPIYEDAKVTRQVGTRIIEKKKGVFSSEIVKLEEPIYEDTIEKIKSEKHSDTHIDVEDFAKRIADACNDLELNGYEIVKITEVVSGRYKYEVDKFANAVSGGANTCYSFGYGYSVTDGVIIIGKK